MKDLKLLKSLTDENRVAWVGDNPVFNFYALNILSSSNLRVAPSMHGQFSSVWLYEHRISDFQAWKVLLDESIRLLDKEGTLVIRMEENPNVNMMNLKKFFFRNALIEKAEIVYENAIKLGHHRPLIKYEHEVTLVIKIKRANPEIYHDKKWTFTVLTQGTKVDNVVGFCESIRSNELNHSEILICGPENTAYEPYDVKYLGKEYDTAYANISEKKNDLIAAASNQNLMIVHDRYILKDDFFTGFEDYGYDYDFITIRQHYESGALFPSYLMLENRLWWSKIIYSYDENTFNDGVFLNGGLLIIKKATAEKCRFNSLIYWDQGEDVELASYMIDNSVIPRLNYFSSAMTLGINDSYTSTFVPFEEYQADNTCQVHIAPTYSTFKQRLVNKAIGLLKRVMPASMKAAIKRGLGL
ncbi:hypothetical protein Dacet_2689 [Denitrovibrio acetiphilus DSM 12809]|uniref:Uncharacterized protein n=1 Tax=Denitrovibrio acetiphilus (strain DSM 12809 / NBRC 114555 / N2460) TaxID=522772 RepID=D4H588_DENA2|nr:hypothetical protein [Denitrovibrio acetiphilus]ADD69444.1 hypothetical protein Dacet_2689 [Denitrovibrio acetiphilus DSM 12809]